MHAQQRFAHRRSANQMWGRDVIKCISTTRNKTAAWTEIIVTDANPTSPCPKKIIPINEALF